MRVKINLHWLGRDTNRCSRYFPQGYLHSPTICHRLVAEDLMKWKQPISVKLLYYINDVLLTSDPLMDLEQWAPELIKHLESCGWAVNATKRAWIVHQVLGHCLVWYVMSGQMYHDQSDCRLGSHLLHIGTNCIGMLNLHQAPCWSYHGASLAHSDYNCD